MTQTFDPQAFLRFCREKPAGEVYPWWDACRCALGQYGRRRIVGAASAEKRGVPAFIFDIVMDGAPTFGALADRLEKALGK